MTMMSSCALVSGYMQDLLDTAGREQHRGKLNCVGFTADISHSWLK